MILYWDSPEGEWASDHIETYWNEGTTLKVEMESGTVHEYDSGLVRQIIEDRP